VGSSSGLSRSGLEFGLGSHSIPIVATVDLVAQAADGTVLLVLIHHPASTGLDVLQQRVHDYVGFAVDGQLAVAYPEVVGQPISIQIDVPSEPVGDLASYLAAIRPRLAAYGLGLLIVVNT
jgi:uncharacterized protein DUF6572